MNMHNVFLCVILLCVMQVLDDCLLRLLTYSSDVAALRMICM